MNGSIPAAHLSGQASLESLIEVTKIDPASITSSSKRVSIDDKPLEINAKRTLLSSRHIAKVENTAESNCSEFNTLLSIINKKPLSPLQFITLTKLVDVNPELSLNPELLSPDDRVWYENIQKPLKEYNPTLLATLPEKLKHPNICLKYLNQAPDNLKYIPAEYYPRFQNEILDIKPSVLAGIVNELNQQQLEALISINYSWIKHIPEAQLTTALCDSFCKIAPQAFELLPATFQTARLKQRYLQSHSILPANSITNHSDDYHSCLKRVTSLPSKFKEIPEHFQTAQFLLTCADQYEKNLSQCWGKGMMDYGLRNFLKNVPVEKCSEALIDRIFTMNQYKLETLPETLKNTARYELACQNDGLSLAEVPSDLITSTLSQLACQNNGLALQSVPEPYKTAALCKLACSQNGMALQYVPDAWKTEEICTIACSQDGNALVHAPESVRNFELCVTALQHCSGWVIHELPPEIKKDERLLEHIESLEALFYQPWEVEGLSFLHWTDDKKRQRCHQHIEKGGALSRVPKKYRDNALCSRAVERALDPATVLPSVPDNVLSDSRFQQLCQKQLHDMDYQQYFGNKNNTASLQSYYHPNLLSLNSQLAMICGSSSDEEKRQWLHNVYSDKQEQVTTRQNLCSQVNPLNRGLINNPFAKDLLATCYQNTAFTPSQLTVADELEAWIKTQCQHPEISALPENFSFPPDTQRAGGRALRIPTGKPNCLYLKLQRKSEPLNELLREGFVHQFLDNKGLRQELKSNYPSFTAFYRISVEQLPVKPDSFDDALEIEDIDGHSYVTAYYYQASANYVTYAHQPDNAATNPFQQPEEGILKACHDIGRFMNWGMLHTSSLPAFHDTDSGRTFLFTHSLLGYQREDKAPGTYPYPGTFGAWNSTATNQPDFGYTGFRDIGDYEKFGHVNSYFKAADCRRETHPEQVNQCLAFANCMMDNLLAALLIRSRLRQHSSGYHYKNNATITETANFISATITAFMEGMGRSASLSQHLLLTEDACQQWLTRCAEEILYWTARQPSERHYPDPCKTAPDKDCYSEHLKHYKIADSLYPEDNSSHRVSGPGDYHNCNGKLNLGGQHAMLPLLTLTNGLFRLATRLFV
ncbi:DUF4116 domain-containing protein [Endozoicomonas ascidiicola]|uniref:DUF4116 domain-containing protein n=1 Tax=Endozoicomonas ascidiicola TaxID=1698521 RepID=UPI000AA2C68C|nr:DUF4116 domain-containing protein [Endozoicomonas ascidiicola]